MKLQVIHYPKCGTCRKAVKWLQEQGHQLELRHIVENPPTAEELRKVAAMSGLEVKKLFNTSGEVYKSLGLKDKLPGMTEQEQLKLLASNGMLVKRPIVTDGARATVGFKEDEFSKVWSK
ncbi:ArsC family protein [Paenibacillus sp. 32O-W]|uniref:arsenate reductase family protein n=1 Tax=Paenibacillus sp. 32O-W TaxID=1695218 RepID=UPI000722BC86|nr:arsenate reductase family protein [Paenibacillus sp. 32O-W]ALS29335.1 ArsC family protein [Paenibacillus sp. 32O-W]